MGGGGGGGDGERAEADTATATATATSTATATASTGASSRDRDDTTTTQPPALHVIVLGSGGGPLESNVTAFLVRSLASGWSKGSVVAVDAGVHLGAIAKILEHTQPPTLGLDDELPIPHTLTTGPFAGLEVPHATPSANAAHIHRSLIDTYLITHPHLDHISGFVINTAGLPGSRPKRLAGLPSTIAAFKTHIFNNVIWPNLSDENNGAGLVTYMRLVEGGSPALGEGEGRGYLEICDGLAVKIWGVSHGHCIERHSHRGSSSSARHGSFDASIMGPMGVGMGVANPPLMSPRALAHHNSANTNMGSFLQQQQREQDRVPGAGGSQVGAPPAGRSGSMSGAHSAGESICVYDSSAYFIRDVTTGREVLIFGDVEPDSISLSPRNQQVWQEAAPKIAAGKLAGVFIECSYDDSQSVDRLFGHLTPRFIVEEMTVLAAEVSAARQAMQQQDKLAQSSTPIDRRQSAGHGSTSDKKKRKRDSIDDHSLLARRKAATPTPSRSNTSMNYPVHLTPNTSTHSEDPVSPKTVKPAPSSTGVHSRRVVASVLPDDSTNTAMVSAIDKSSGAGADGGNYFDSPHLSTPTAELTLQDLADISSSTTTTNNNIGPATPPSMNNSGGGLPPPIIQGGMGMSVESGSVFHHEPFRISLPTAAAVDGPHDMLHSHPHSRAPSQPHDHDYDVSMGMVPQREVEEVQQQQQQWRNGDHHIGELVDTEGEEEGAEGESEVGVGGERKGEGGKYPLRGLKVVVIHVKDKMTDGPRAGEVILEELRAHERGLKLGCEYVVSEAGQDLYL